tara:strand:+ start:883 stop:2016 length:1134 start_codon:yes stop_codon:yes gene_type:complete
MTREQILNSNLSPEEKQRRLNELANNNAAQGATLNSLLQVPINQFGSPTAIRPVVTESNPKPSVNTFPLRDLPAPPNVDLPRINIAPPNTANTTNVPKRGIFDRFANAFEQANPFFAMGAEFNKMGSPRAFGSQVQADPIGAFRRAKYGEIKKPLREERLAKQLGISLEDYMKTYGKTLNPLVNEIKLTEYKKISEDADAGRNALNNLKVMQSILDDPDFKTGTLENAKMKVRAGLKSIGMLNDENTLLLKEAETFDALSNNSILPLVKMLGVNPTDRDLMFVQSAAPTLSKSKETNKLLIKSLISAQKRKIRLQQVYAAMSAENPTLDHPTLQMNALQQVADEFESEMNEILAEAKRLSIGTSSQESKVTEIVRTN